jgi:hypothetical protein
MAADKPYCFDMYEADPATCKHPKYAILTKVLSAVVCCETTVTVCGHCGEHLTPQETNC